MLNATIRNGAINEISGAINDHDEVLSGSLNDNDGAINEINGAINGAINEIGGAINDHDKVLSGSLNGSLKDENGSLNHNSLS